MHFMASPATFFTAAYERILFTKHFSGTAFIYCAVPQRIECGTSTVALEDVHQAGARKKSQCNKWAFPLNRRRTAAFVCTAACNFAERRSKRGVLISNGRWQKLFGETNNGPICSCHHRGDALYRGHGVFGRVDDVLRRFDRQGPEHPAHVDARGVSGAHYIAPVRSHTIALTLLATPAHRPRRS